jgi:hypothetical protein
MQRLLNIERDVWIEINGELVVICEEIIVTCFGKNASFKLNRNLEKMSRVTKHSAEI